MVLSSAFNQRHEHPGAEFPSLGAVTPALVTHAHSRAAVAGIRAFGAAGIEAIALAAHRNAAGLWSRHSASRALGPGSESPGAWLERIADLARGNGPLVVYPGQEEGVAALWDRALPPEALVPYPGAEPLRALRDKGSLAALSRDAGIASPLVLAEGPAAAIAADPSRPPTVLKARDFADAMPAAVVCDTDAALREALEKLPADEPVVVQEHVEGRLIAVSVVLDRDGVVVARFQQEALRLWPPGAGPSSLGRSVAPDDDLVERVAALLRSAGYWGLAQVQLLATPRGPAAIDVNPRFYGSLPLATRAGVNLPSAWHAVAIGDPPPPQRPYRTGVVYRWLEADLAAAWRGNPGRLRTHAPRPRAGAMWSWDDPVPGAILASQAAAARLPALARRLRR